MSKEMIKYSLISNARGAPDLKLRNGPGLMKTRGAPDWITRGTPLGNESWFQDWYRKEDSIREYQFIKFRERTTE